MLDCIVVETKDVAPVIYERGAVKWVANSDLAPGCEQRFGLVHILPGKTNPEHRHPATEELVFKDAAYDGLMRLARRAGPRAAA